MEVFYINRHHHQGHHRRFYSADYAVARCLSVSLSACPTTQSVPIQKTVENVFVCQELGCGA